MGETIVDLAAFLWSQEPFSMPMGTPLEQRIAWYHFHDEEYEILENLVGVQADYLEFPVMVLVDPDISFKWW